MTVDAAEARVTGIRHRQRRLWALAGGAAILGVATGAPALVPIGMVVGTLALVREAWLRRGLRGLEYRRDLGARVCVWGDEVAVTISVWNRSLLPLAWVRTDDSISEPTRFRGAAPVESLRMGNDTLSNAWTLLPFERVERRFNLLADQRGRVAFGPVHL